MAVRKIKLAQGSLAIWKKVVGVFQRQPSVYGPFLLMAAIEFLALVFLYNSPHFPVKIVMGPPIRRIWGPVYMHYPFFYELLPRLFYYAKIVLSIFIGSVTSGTAVLAIAQAVQSKQVVLKDIFRQVLKRYLSLILLTTILFVSVHFLMKQPAELLIGYFRAGHSKLLFLGPKFWITQAVPVLNFIFAVFFQGLFVFSIPYVVIRGKKFLPALGRGIVLFFKRFVPTMVVVTVPMILYIPVTMLRGNISFLAEKFTPEIVGLVLLAGIVVGTLIVDVLLTTATTLIFLEAKDEA